MDIDDNPKPDVKKWALPRGKLSTVIGSVAVLAVGILAGLVFTRYEAGILPAEAALTSQKSQFIPVTVSEPDPAVGMKSIPGESPHAAPTAALPAASGGPERHTSAVVGGMCSLDRPVTS